MILDIALAARLADEDHQDVDPGGVLDIARDVDGVAWAAPASLDGVL